VESWRVLSAKQVQRLADSLNTVATPSWRALPWVIAVGVGLRIIVSLSSEPITHADEVFQFLEQAHRLVFGYGVIPWEYVYGTRSWLLPGSIAFVLWGFSAVGLDNPSFYVPAIRILACILSGSAIYCVYWIGRRLVSERVGRIGSVLTCCWYEVVIVGHKVTPEVLSTYLLLGAVTCLVRRPTNVGVMLFGLCCGAALALRIQYAPVLVCLALMMLLYCRQGNWTGRQSAIALATFSTVVLFVGWLDYYTWGYFFVGYYNYFLYNAVYGISHKLFGADPFWQYAKLLGGSCRLLFAATIAYSPFRNGPKPWLLLALLACILGPHSLMAHKEYRFIFAAIPLCLLLTAILIDDLWQWPRWRFKISLGKALTCVYGFATIVGLAKFGIFAKDEFPGGLHAYRYIHQQQNVAAVVNLYAPWHLTGRYYYLHRDVPVYFPNDLEANKVAAADLSRYVSHIVCERDYEAMPGFTTRAWFGRAEVRAADRPPSMSLPADTHRRLQKGIDGVYEPAVTPRF